MGLFNILTLIEEIEKEIDNEKKKSKNTKKLSENMEYIDLTNKVESPSQTYERKEKQRKLKESLENKFGKIEDKSFEERYGKFENPADKKYNYSDAGESELSDTVKYEEDILYSITENEISDKKPNYYAKKLKNKKNARDAFISSIIFNRR